MEMIEKKLVQGKRILVVPIDHPIGEDTKKLAKTTVQEIVSKLDNENHDGYIFHARDYLRKPIKTKKNFFLTVGELPEKYKTEIEDLLEFSKITGNKLLTVFFEVESKEDKNPILFYKEYIGRLKEKGFKFLGMGYPSEKSKGVNYQIIADIAKEMGCDYFKTDFTKELKNICLHGMKLFIAGGSCINDSSFEKFILDVANLEDASYSFGRNIFESNNPKERINKILRLIDDD